MAEAMVPARGVDLAPRGQESSEGAVRAAALLLAIGSEAAGVVLKAMPEEKVAIIARAARHLRDAADDIGDVALTRFVETMERFEQDRTTRTRAFEDLLKAALGEDAAQRALVQPKVDEEALAVAPIVAADDADVALLLERESPQVIALVLSVLQPEKAAAILEKLPIEKQAPSVQALAQLDAVEPSYVADVVAGLAEQIKDLVVSPTRRRPVGGEKSAADVLRRFKPDDRKPIIDELERIAPDLAGSLKSKLFSFDDIQRLGKRDIQAFLQTCDPRTLALGLKGAPPSVTDAITANMSQRAAAVLREEISMLGRVRLAHVEAAQAEVVRSILALAEQGKINVNFDEAMV